MSSPQNFGPAIVIIEREIEASSLDTKDAQIKELQQEFDLKKIGFKEQVEQKHRLLHKLNQENEQSANRLKMVISEHQSVIKELQEENKELKDRINNGHP
jgi:hypothetical protein